METPITCIYHKDCVDGTTAAAVVLRKFPNARFFPLSHSYTNEEIATICSVTPKETNILMVDCAIGVEALLEEGYAITIIDHHISDMERMQDLAQENDQLTYIFDNKKSGASLTWAHFFPDEPLPELIALVEDSDLWNQQYGDVTKDVNHYLSVLRNDPEKVLACIEGDIAPIKERGQVISRYTDKVVEKLITIPPVTVTIGKYPVLAFNITDHQSACGDILSKKFDQAVALYTIAGNKVKIGFRSVEHQTPSALELAELLGGGGHRNSSGAGISLEEASKLFASTESIDKT